jgi:hypothetical protein
MTNKKGGDMKKIECGAKTRHGEPCQAPAMKNGRCKLHGGKSTGPKTEKGKANALANLVQYRKLADDCSIVSASITALAIEQAIPPPSVLSLVGCADSQVAAFTCPAHNYRE